jgi:hypothetical protein
LGVKFYPTHTENLVQLQEGLTLDNCPLCNSPLEKGFVNTVRNVYWDTKIRESHLFGFGAAGGEKSFHLKQPFRTVKATVA